MLGTSPPTNWSQISEEIPLSLVIISHRKWDSGEDEMGEKDGGFQISVTPVAIDTVVLSEPRMIGTNIAPCVAGSQAMTSYTNLSNSYTTCYSWEPFTTSSHAQFPDMKFCQQHESAAELYSLYSMRFTRL